ncbi:hypothetical protein GJ496_002986, partial [Pomphorhynchus laevis]
MPTCKDRSTWTFCEACNHHICSQYCSHDNPDVYVKKSDGFFRAKLIFTELSKCKSAALDLHPSVLKILDMRIGDIVIVDQFSVAFTVHTSSAVKPDVVSIAPILPRNLKFLQFRKPGRCISKQLRIVFLKTDIRLNESTIQSKPKPTCTWMFNSKPIKQDDRITSGVEQIKLSDEYRCYLQIKQAAVQDGGSYRLVAKNSNGELRAAVNLNLQAEEEDISSDKKPKFTQKPVIKQDASGSKVIFECMLSAEPKPNCIWYKNEKQIEDKGKYSLSINALPDNCYMLNCTVSNISAEDGGVYKVVAKNSFGEASANMNLNFNDDKGKPIISKDISVRPFQTDKGSNVIIECQCDAVQSPEFVWYFKNKEIVPSNKYTMSSLNRTSDIHTCMLSINDVRKQDTGIYRLLAKNSIGEHSANIDIDISSLSSSKSTGHAPRIAEKPTYKLENGNLTMSVTFDAEPAPLINWNAKNHKLSDERHLIKKDLIRQMYSTELVLKNCTKLDADEYECVAFNEHGSCKVIINLKLLDFSKSPQESELSVGATIVGKPRIIYKKKNNTMVVCCDLDSAEDLKPAWFKSNMKLQPSSKYNMTQKDKGLNRKTVQLDIKNYNGTTDNGIYRLCTNWSTGESNFNIDINSANATIEDEDKDEEEDAKTDEKIEETEKKKPEVQLDDVKKQSDDVKKQPDDTKKQPDESRLKNTAEVATKSEGVVAKKAADMKGAKPSFAGNFKPVVAVDGDRVVLKCDYKSDVPVEVNWTIDGKQLKLTEQYDLDDTGKTVTLTLLDSYQQDSGTYRCKLTNQYGSDEKQCRVTVSAKRGKMARRKPVFGPKKLPKQEPESVEIKDEAIKAKSTDEKIRRVSQFGAVEDKGKVGVKQITAKPVSQPESVEIKDEAIKAKSTDEKIRRVSQFGAAEDKGTVGVKQITAKPVSQKTDSPDKIASGEEVTSKAVNVADENSKKEKGDEKERKPSLITKPQVDNTAGDQQLNQPLKKTLKKPIKLEKKQDNFSDATPVPFSVGGKWPTLKKTTHAKKVPDHWVNHLVDTKAKEEDGVVTLEATFCRSGGKLRWYKNRVEIFHGPKYNFITEGPVQKLQINKMIPDDSGRYICSVNDIETKSWLAVEGAKPEYDFYLQLPVKNTVFRTKPVILECHVNSSDCPIKWLKGEKQIETNDPDYKFYLDGTRCVLRINHVKRSDEGKFTCVIDDGSGKQSECYLYIEEPQWRFSQKLPQKLSVKEKECIVLEVEVEDLEAECEWYFKGEMITPEDFKSGKYEIVVDGFRRIMRVNDADPVKDAGFYECRTGVMTTDCQVSVQPLLRIVKELQDVEAIEKRDITLSAQLSKAVPTVSWLKDGKRILPTASNLILNDGVNYSLTLKNVSFEDAGRYTMKVMTLETSADITVREENKPPSIGHIPKLYSIPIGKPIEINVPFKGYPPPTVTWLKDGKPIDVSSVDIRNTNSESTLRIPVSNASHQGEYTLRLENSSGKDEVAIAVQICDRPDPPNGPLRVTQVKKESCNLNWNHPDNDGGSPITGYVIEKQDVLRGDWEEVGTVSANTLSFPVKNLTANKKYAFRVKAKNKINTSEPLAVTSPITAKDPYDPPSSPEDLLVKDVDFDYVSLNWKPPVNNGGAPIDKYIIEKKEEHGNWIIADKIDGDAFSVTVKNLVQDKNYDFRVTAVNKAGLGTPCTGISVKTSPKIVRPFITKNSLKDITVKVGQEIKLNVLYRAKPSADCKWEFKGQEIQLTDRMKINFDDKMCELIIKDATRADVGIYKITLSNSAGADSAKANVVVLGPPGKMKKPLKVADVTSDSAVLSWEPPDDDGGKPIQSYVIEKREVGGQWTPAGTTSGTRLKVTNLKEGRQYDFRVMAENSVGVGEPLVTDEPIVAKNPYDRPGATNKPNVVNRDRKHIVIEWKQPEDDGGAPVVGYIVERKESESGSWKPVHRDDYITGLKFTDNQVKANAPYEYRVKAVNKAGAGDASPSTGVVLAKPEKEAPKIDDGKIPTISGQREIRINAGEPLEISLDYVGSPNNVVTWTKDNEPFGTSVKIEDVDENTTLSVPITRRSDSGNYKVSIKNDQGEDEASIKVIVQDVPSQCMDPLVPSNTTKISTTLKWDIPEDNGGSAITGYVVEKCKEGSTTWEPVGTCDPYDTKIIADKLEPMQNYNFRVKAENKSGLSEPLQTISPVLIKPPYDVPSAPSEPIITDFDTDHISIEWEKPLNDGGNPISGYVVEMRDGRGDWIPATTKPVTGTQFTATGLKPNHPYEFRVRAENDGGLGDASHPSKQQKAVSPINPPGPTESPVVTHVDHESATITWKPPEDNGGDKITKYDIEMRTNNGDWISVGEANGRDKQLTIPKLKEGSEVSFRIRAENSAGPGTPSSPSDVVTIKDPPSPPAFSNISKLKDITVRAGQPFFASAQYTAVPEPAVECIHDNTPVISDDIYTAKAENGVVTVGSKCAKRDDCGVYKILLKNSEGVVSASFLVNVLDVPLKPDGPLDVSGVDHDRCTLRWNPPKDDGGSPITSYVIEKRPVGSDKWLKACPSTPSTFANVQNLENGVNYEFRVIAENINGRSEPLTVDDSVRIKSPHKAPDSPDTPRCIDHTEDSITIAWNKPLSDGGAPINGYLVEIRDSPNSSWKPLFTAPKSGRTATAKNLEDGHVYEFRVSAVNNAGQSPWAETDEPIEARPQDFTPYIPYTSTKTIKVKEGEPIEIDIPFVASPLPESIFSKNGYNIPEDDRHIFRTETNRAILSIPSAELSDAGPYTCLLKNNAGQCEHGVNVVVIGKPSKPEGPLIATDCSAYGCTLTWSPPKTENGAPITNYIIEKCDPRTGIWEVVSKFCRNPQYEVFDLDENNIYSFRVSAENEAGISEPLEIDKPVKAQYPASTPSAPRSLRVDENKFDRVTLTWDEPLKDNGAKITGYIVECKPAGSSEWDELTITPTRDTSFSVEHLLPSKSYDFRVCAVNSMGKSDYENLDKPLKTKDVLKPPDKPSPPEALSVGDTFAQIVWDTPSNLLDDIPLTYKVQKKIEGNDTWEAVTVSPGSDNFLTVFGLPTNSNVEFRVCASNSAGDSEWSDTSGKFKVTSYPNGKPPTFIRQLEESVNVNPGSYIRLEVDFTGLPQPDVKWLKNGLQIIPGIKYAIQTKDQHSTLILQDIWDVDDGTEFTCEITNPIGSETTTSKLNVRVPPKISKFDRNLSAIVGEPVKLQIPVEATRGLQFDVKKLDDSNLLDVNDLFNVKDEDGLVSISLKEAKLDDSGEYVIYMKNDAGVANTHFSVDVKGPPGKPEGPLEPFDVNKTSCKLSWKPPHEDGNSRIINYIVEKHDVAKDSDQWVPIDINCKDTSLTVDNLLPDHEYEFRVKAVNNIGEGTPLYSSNTIVAALPFGPPKCMSAPEVTAVGSDSVRLSWVKAISDSEVSPINYHIEKRLKDSDEWYPVSTGGLLTRNSVEVPHLLEGREYEFRVIAENEAGCGNPSPPTDPVLISDPYALKAPVIVSKFSDMTVNENTSNKFQVEVANAANADITWYKGTTELHSGSDYTISKIGDVCSLLLNNVKPEDNDETFTFKIKNPAGSRSCRANLIVNSKPRIKLPARYQDVQELTSKDKDITIKIPYTANPMPADTWYINGQPLNTIDNDDVTSTLTSTGATLHIRNPEILGDSGKVELRLENPLGTADAFVSYVVSGKPSIPMNLKADTVYDDCATLSWQPPQSDGGSRITDYCLEMMDGSNEGKWEKVAACRSTRYVVPNLTPNNLYHFRVSAINQNGQSEPSVLLENVCTEHKVDSKYKKAPYGTDNEGKPIRGIEGQAPEDYDRVFHDIWKTNVNPHAPVVNAGSIYDKYDVYEEIGRSSFAVVHRAVDKSTGRNYAVKFIDTSEDGDMSAIEKEIDMMGNLVDSNIVNLREAYQTIDESALVYELLTGDTLVDKLNNSQKITEPEVINLVRQVCQAVKTLHDNNIAHLDLK